MHFKIAVGTPAFLATLLLLPDFFFMIRRLPFYVLSENGSRNKSARTSLCVHFESTVGAKGAKRDIKRKGGKLPNFIDKREEDLSKKKSKT
uniref:Uncharacterized protein n=1 Tax=Megaselia scalaris TaxID=36166 RepID=T1GXM5_MEGSC